MKPRFKIIFDISFTWFIPLNESAILWLADNGYEMCELTLHGDITAYGCTIWE